MLSMCNISEQAVFTALKYRIEVDSGGTRRYLNNAGQIHRDDGPALETISGRKCWYQNGLLHRTDGPAVEWANGTKYWYRCRRLHRTDGPAIELVFTNGYISKAWYIDDTELTVEEFNQEVKDYERTRSI